MTLYLLFGFKFQVTDTVNKTTTTKSLCLKAVLDTSTGLLARWVPSVITTDLNVRL